MSKLIVSESQDFTITWLFHIDTIDFTNASGTTATAIFDGRQFTKLGISPAVTIDGSAGRNVIEVHTDYRGLDASGWNFVGWSGADRIVIQGSFFSEVLTGSSQRDIISGAAGSDTIRGRAGADIISGGAGFDRLYGGAGADTLSYKGSTAAVRIDLAKHTAFGGDATGDTFRGFEHVIGSGFNDDLTGNALNNRLIGGLGADDLRGGEGADRFVFRDLTDSYVSAGHDLILDFSHAQHDRIKLSGIDAIFGSGDDAFTFIGTATFTEAGQLRYQINGNQTLVQADVDGDHFVDFEIALTGAHNLVADDFIL